MTDNTLRNDSNSLFKFVLMKTNISGSINEYLSKIDWLNFLTLMSRNTFLIRSHQRLSEFDFHIPNPEFDLCVRNEINRIKQATELINKLSILCEKNNIKYVYPKAFQHYPDMGHDIDLYVHDRSFRIDKLIIKEFGAIADTNSKSLVNLISGKTGYLIPGYSTPVEIHHGRMGILGEHNVYPDLVIRNRVRFSIDGISVFQPCPEDRLIIQALQRIYGHFSIRLSDAVSSFQLLSEPGLNLDYIKKTADRIGLLEGVICYVSYISQIYHSLFEEEIFSSEKIRKEFVSRKWGDVLFGRRNYQFPLLPNLLYLFGIKMMKDLLSANCESFFKLASLPFVATYIAGRNLIKKNA
jgi:hypothetical protein